jgi:hypothetical protein
MLSKLAKPNIRALLAVVQSPYSLKHYYQAIIYEYMIASITGLGKHFVWFIT